MRILPLSSDLLILSAASARKTTMQTLSSEFAVTLMIKKNIKPKTVDSCLCT